MPDSLDVGRLAPVYLKEHGTTTQDETRAVMSLTTVAVHPSENTGWLRTTGESNGVYNVCYQLSKIAFKTTIDYVIRKAILI